MKKMLENRYPNSATLFKFCKEALEIRYEGNVKVIDQDVGAILGYDPADCSHWKKGKKNIRALSTLKSIADHLNIDERLLIDITSGHVALEEAVFEYKGYGQFALEGQNLENLKKEYFKNPGRWLKGGSVRVFEDIFDVGRVQLTETVDQLLKMGTFSEAPIYIQEIFSLFSGIELTSNPELTQAFLVEKENEGTVTRVSYREADMRPYVRFLALKELFHFLCETRHSLVEGYLDSPEEVMEVRSHIFAELVLVPLPLLKKEVAKVDSTLDIVAQLSQTFWVSKALMNQRLSDFMQYLQ